MKNPSKESMRCLQRQYHRSHPWHLRAKGCFIPHDYSQDRVLSWWDDVGFILNRRRIMVWWVHPRMKYADAIEDACWKEVGELPDSLGDFLDDNRRTKQYQRLGRSRKKVIGYRSQPPVEAKNYFDKLSAIRKRIENEGIDFVARPSMTIQMLNWCTGVELCLAIEVLNEKGVIALADIVRQALKTGRSLAALNAYIPDEGYQYGRVQWLAEAEARNRDSQFSSVAIHQVSEHTAGD